MTKIPSGEIPRHRRQQTKRVQFDMTEEAFQRLTSLRERSNKTSNAETVRMALRLLEWFIDKKEKGERIQVCKKDGSIVEVTLLAG